MRRLSRRDFLITTGAVGVGHLLGRLLLLFDQKDKVDVGPEKTQSKEWRREEYLLNPLPLLDAYRQHCQESRDFVGLQATDLLADRAENAERRRGLEQAYTQMGEQLIQVIKTIEAVFPLASGQTTKMTELLFSNLKIFWCSWDALAAELADEKKSREVYSRWPDDLETITNWCLPAGTNTDREQQRAAYRQRAQERSKTSQLWDNTRRTWDMAIRLTRSAQPPKAWLPEKWRTWDGYKRFKRILETWEDLFPGILQNIDTIDFFPQQYISNKNMDRAYYDPAMETIILGEYYPWAVIDQTARQAWEKPSTEDSQSLSMQINENTSLNNVIMAHELAHGIDLFDRPIPDCSHPADYVDMALIETTMVATFWRQLPRLSAADWQNWFFDPETPKHFGVDQLLTATQCHDYVTELKIIQNVYRQCVAIWTKYPAVAAWTKENVSAFALWNGMPVATDLPFWQILCGTVATNDPLIKRWQVNGLAQLRGGDLKRAGLLSGNIRDFSCLNDALLTDLIDIGWTLVMQTEQSNSFVAQLLQPALLAVKQLAMLSLSAIVAGWQQGGVLVGVEKNAAQELNESIVSLQAACSWHVLHTLRGPLGEYFPCAQAPTLGTDQWQVAEETITHFAAERRQQQAALMTAGWSAAQSALSQEAVTFLDIWARYVPLAMSKRATSWGARQGLAAYQLVNQKIQDEMGTP